MKKQKLYIFTHIYKCAGTTLNFHLKYNFKQEETLFLFRGHGFYNIKTKKYKPLKNFNHINKYLNSLTEKQKNKIKIIHGHDIPYGIHKFFPNKIPIYITIIREPFSRMVSEYSQIRRILKKDLKIVSDEMGNLSWKSKIEETKRENLINKKPISFEEYLKKLKINNPILNFLKERNFIKKSLDKFYFIGLTENFNKDLLFLSKILKFKKFYLNKNITKKYSPLKSMSNKKIRQLKQNFMEKNKIDYKLYDLSIKHNQDFKSKISNLDQIIKQQKIKRWLSIPFSETERILKLIYKRLTKR